MLFSADGFGNFGGLTYTPDWGDEARRYYANIVGKYGVQVQGLLKKAAALEIASVCPLHGPQLSGDALARALELYGHWAAWKPEEKGVLVALRRLPWAYRRGGGVHGEKPCMRWARRLSSST